MHGREGHSAATNASTSGGSRAGGSSSSTAGSRAGPRVRPWGGWAQVGAKGDEIRDAKKAKAAKEAIMSLVEQLKALKEEYEKAVGEPFPAPVAAPKKEEGGRPAVAVQGWPAQGTYVNV